MRQLHTSPIGQQRGFAVRMHSSIVLWKNEGDKYVLFTRNSEDTYKRPENIRVQEQ